MPITELENNSESVWVKVQTKGLIMWQYGVDNLVVPPIWERAVHSVYRECLS